MTSLAPLTPPLTAPSSPTKVSQALDFQTPPSPVPHPASALLYSATAAPLKAVHAEGIYMTLEDGRTIIDGVGGAAVASLGMGNPEVVEAMMAQVTKMGYSYHQLVGNDPSEELSRFLVERSRGALHATAFLSSGASFLASQVEAL